MKLGISSYSFPWAVGVKNFPKPKKPILALDIIDFAAEQNLDVVQFGDNLPIDVLSLSEIEMLKEYSDKKNISIEIGTRGTDPSILNKYIDCAQILDAKIIRTLLPKESVENIVTDLLKVEERLKENNIRIAIENYEAFCLDRKSVV